MESGQQERCLKGTQESEDSSYDSDCEVSDTGTAQHYDVSRTVSDTLGQEFAEYVTLDTVTTSPGYNSRVEFGKKLGYSESQVQMALSKLGPSTSQNELLSELILLDSSNVTPTPNNETKTENITKIQLRHIVIDGSNVAMSHGGNKTFSCRGIELAVEYFRSRGHKNITVFVPSYRKEHSHELSKEDLEKLSDLEKSGTLVYTPSRVVNNKRLVCYDDRYILKLAVEVDGIVVSNDNYRDLTLENNDFKKIVSERLLMFSFVNDRFMPPEDPCGRNGPPLPQFLSHNLPPSAPPCPYNRKCTYGQKCKYYHETPQKSITETLRKQAAMKTQSVPITKSSFSSSSQTKTNLLPISRTKSALVTMESVSSSTCEVNTHRKLQRQLSINPQGDPRVFNWKVNNNSGNEKVNNSFNPFPGEPILNQVWEPIEQNTSSSDVAGAKSFETNFETPARTKMYYHLSAIFPESQVRHVMNLYPQETDSKFICTQICQMFN